MKTREVGRAVDRLIKNYFLPFNDKYVFLIHTFASYRSKKSMYIC